MFILYFKGFILLIFAVLIFYFSYYFYTKNRFQLSLFFILLGGGILRVWSMLDPFLHQWDERYHALVAKNMLLNPILPLLYKNTPLPYDYKMWVMNHIWLHKPPLTLWLISLSFYFFGANEWAVRCPSLLLSVAGIYLTFHIARFFTNQKIALLACFFQSINGFVIDVASGRQSTDHVDNVFFFLMELSIFFSVKYIQKKRHIYLIAIAVSVGLALLTKSFLAFFGIILFFILISLYISYKKSIYLSFLLTFGALLIYLPWYIYIITYFPNEHQWEQQYTLLHLTQVIEGHKGNFFWHFFKATRIWNELVYLALFVFFYHVIKKKVVKQKAFFLIIWLGLPYLFFSLVVTKMVAYPLFTAPAIFIIEAYFINFLLEEKSLNNRFYWKTILIFAFLFLAVRYSYERLKPYREPNTEDLTAQYIKSWQPILSKRDKCLVFNNEHYVESMFYYDNCISYPFLPEKKITDSLKSCKYSLYKVEKNEKDSLILKTIK